MDCGYFGRVKFNGVQPNVRALLSKVVDFSLTYADRSSSEGRMETRQTHVVWMKPESNWIKINIHGSVNPSLHQGETAFFLRDSKWTMNALLLVAGLLGSTP